MVRAQEKAETEIISENRMEIILLIESLRSDLEKIIAFKQNYTDPKVLAVSQELDKAINEFYRKPAPSSNAKDS